VRKVFISYARQNKPDIEQLVEHLRVLGCDTWHDSSLHGGEDWWQQILQRIADCDTFIAIISRDALTSTACRREFDWAESLNKPVMPVAVEPPPKALPGRFSKRQIVDYSDRGSRDRAALRLAGGLATLPGAPPLPDPLPEQPAPPLSYLTNLVDLVSQPEPLDHGQQRDVLHQLEPALHSIDPEERRGGSEILEMLSARDDLYADVYLSISRLQDMAHPSPDRANTELIGPEGPRAFVLRYAARSDRGLVYENNEDSVYAGARLQAIADGKGNPTGGSVASQLVIASLAHLDDEEPGDDVLAKLHGAVVEANDAIAARVEMEPSLKGVGTTLTALLFEGRRAALAHIGASRAYLLRDGVLNQVTQDEFRAPRVYANQLSAAERTGLMRRLTGDVVPITLKELESRAGDRYLLCTAGLTDLVDQDRILDALQIPNVDESAAHLIELALRGGGSDNVTVVVSDVLLAGDLCLERDEFQ
jgi:serine/threonine protein phosphatase PrpC